MKYMFCRKSPDAPEGPVSLSFAGLPTFTLEDGDEYELSTPEQLAFAADMEAHPWLELDGDPAPYEETDDVFESDEVSDEDELVDLLLGDDEVTE